MFGQPIFFCGRDIPSEDCCDVTQIPFFFWGGGYLSNLTGNKAIQICVLTLLCDTLQATLNRIKQANRQQSLPEFKGILGYCQHFLINL